MLVKNAPDQLPLPRPEFGGWEPILDGLVGVSAGLAGFVVFAILLTRYMPKVAFLSGLSIEPAPKGGNRPISMTKEPESETRKLKVGQGGIADSILRPAGQARFDNAIVDVVAQGEYVQKGENVEIIEIHGNRVVVRKA
jgi:membrane-bound serine protease (ClpP class)